MSRNPVAAYGEWLASVPADWPEAAIESARRQFIDTLGVLVPGALEPVSQRIFQTVSRWGQGRATAIGMGASVPAPWAATINGAAAHALDFDDNFDPAKAHASAVLVPAILALAEEVGNTGLECLDAYVAGLQILGRIGQGVNPAHRNRGWHATATVGAIGAAAACGRLLRLDAAKAAHALSIATSMAAGFMSQFGSQTKPLHAGLAAKSGVLAACLARGGIDAGMDTLDGPHGMNRLMVGPDYELLRDTLTHVEHGQNLRFETESIGEPLLILSSGFRVKRFPNCGSAHRAMDGVLALMAQHGLAANAIEAVHVRAPVTHLNNLMYVEPTDGLEAKFSLEHGIAVAALTGNAALADFTDEAAARGDFRAFRERVHRHPVDKAEGEFATEVELALNDGRGFETAVAMPSGSLAAPFTIEQVWAKFEGCTAGILTPDEAAALRDALDRLPQLASVEPLLSPLSRRFAS
ncbi:MAG: MmgE/PrpD family protein [Sphingosinicella sp.]